MKRIRIAVCGFGKLGRECALNLLSDPALELAGIVRRPDSLALKLPAPFTEVPAAAHSGELGGVDAALVCVPAAFVLETVRNLLQHGIPIAECAILHGAEGAAHRASCSVTSTWNLAWEPTWNRLRELSVAIRSSSGSRSRFSRSRAWHS